MASNQTSVLVFNWVVVYDVGINDTPEAEVVR